MEIQVKLNIPDELLNGEGEQVSRSVLEQVIAESYKDGRFKSQVSKKTTWFFFAL